MDTSKKLMIVAGLGLAGFGLSRVLMKDASGDDGNGGSGVQFSMPAAFTKAEVTGQWDMSPYYYICDFECPITNLGPEQAAAEIVITSDPMFSDGNPKYQQLTLEPGETYLWKWTQLTTMLPFTMYLVGDWPENNHSQGTATRL